MEIVQNASGLLKPEKSLIFPSVKEKGQRMISLRQNNRRKQDNLLAVILFQHKIETGMETMEQTCFLLDPYSRLKQIMINMPCP